MKINYQRGHAEIFGSSHQDGCGINAKSRLLLAQNPIVWMKNYSKYNVERQV